MPRPPRIEVEDGVHHVYARGNGRQLVFRDNADRAAYLRVLAHVVRHKKWRLLSYCLMDNHVHLLIETPEPNLGSGMQWLHGLYAQHFNRRHDHVGHVFQGRYGSVLIETAEHLWTVAVYIARNPVEAALSLEPEAWPWSSFSAVLGDPRPAWLDVDRLVWHLEAVSNNARRTFAAFVKGSDP